MTIEEIVAMEPGRELDELVSKEIFDWDMEPMREYSSDIDAAWDVVKKFNEVTVKRFETMKGHRYWCRIEYDYDKDSVVAQGDEAPEAICKAALLAKLAETHA